jgi:hypothetical protein
MKGADLRSEVGLKVGLEAGYLGIHRRTFVVSVSDYREAILLAVQLR